MSEPRRLTAEELFATLDEHYASWPRWVAVELKAIRSHIAYLDAELGTAAGHVRELLHWLAIPIADDRTPSVIAARRWLESNEQRKA